MSKILNHRFVNWTASFTLNAVDRSALFFDRVATKVMRHFRP